MKYFMHKSGKVYFSRKTERVVFFVLTMIMLGWLVVEKCIAFMK